MTVLALLLLGALGWLFVLNRRLGKTEARLQVLERALSTEDQEEVASADEAEHEPAAAPEEPTTEPADDAAAAPREAVVFGSGESAIRVPPEPDAPEQDHVEEDLKDADAPVSATGAGGRDLEKTIGSRWAIWVGGLALALGGVFLVRYSIEQGIFSPAVRLSMAAAAGLLALAAGEYIRRRDLRLAFAGDRSAHVPGILTAAGAAILFAVSYAAHGLYGFIGPAMAFAALGVVSLATILLSLRHGPLLAAFGCIGSYATPALVSSDNPDPWALFSYLAVVLVTSAVLARLRGSVWLINTALLGTTFWAAGFALGMEQDQVRSLLLPIAAIPMTTLLVWERNRSNRVGALTDYGKRRHHPVHLAGVAVALIALASISGSPDIASAANIVIATAVCFLLALAVIRRSAWLSALIAPYLAVSALFVWSRLGLLSLAGFVAGQALLSSDLQEQSAFLWPAVGLGTLHFLVGAWMSGRLAGVYGHAFVWSLSSVSAAVGGFVLTAILYANLNFDIRFGLAASAIVLMFVAAGALVASRQPAVDLGRGAVAVYLWAAGLFAGAAIHLLTTPAWTGITFAAAALIVAIATRRWAYAALRWISVAFAAVVVVRFGIDPAITSDLSARPVLNWLLPGYFLPALSFAACAWVFSGEQGLRARHAMQGLSATAAIVGAAMLIRHGMSGGQLAAGDPLTLGEQTLYTLLSLGASATLIRLDDRSPSPVFRLGSILVGYAGLGMAAYLHAVPLNPLFNADLVGEGLVFNLVTAGYLLPAVCAAAVWWFARDRRPRHYVVFLGCVALLFLLEWVGLAVRHYYNAPILAHFMNPPASTLEAFTYMPAFLAVGLAASVLANRILPALFVPASRTLAAAALIIGVVVNFIGENPLATNAPMGERAVFNLVTLGYLVPAILLSALAWSLGSGNNRAGWWLHRTIGVFAAAMFFVWVSLTIRWFYHGPYIGAWIGALPAETYTYSAVWLVLGIAVLVVGQIRRSRFIRIASGLLITLTVLKVFLIDMSELQGVLRAFSFMGLGAALIGIGLFYQRIFSNDGNSATEGTANAGG